MFVDAALREREATVRPIRVGMVGAGATGRAIALQLGTPAPGIRLVAIANRTHPARPARGAPRPRGRIAAAASPRTGPPLRLRLPRGPNDVRSADGVDDPM